MKFLNPLRSFFCMLAILLTVASAEASVIKISLNNLEIGIDSETGSLVFLNSPHTPMLLQAAPDGGLLDIAYPVDSFAAMRLASRFSKATVTQPGADEVDIQWDRLDASRPNLALPSGAVSARVVIKAASDGKSVVMTCHIENKSGASVRQELFPDLWGLKPIAGFGNTRLRLARKLVIPFEGPVMPVDAAPFFAKGRALTASDSESAYPGLWWKSYPAGSYYNENALRWLDYGGLEGGLSIFQKKWGSNDWPGIFTRRTEKDPDSLRLAWEQQQDIAPGKSWDSGEFWLTPHAGGWAKGIEVYRDYVNQVNPPRELPINVRDDVGFQTIWMIQTPEVDPAKAAFRFSDLPRVAEDAKQYGIHEVVPWGWCTYSTLPIPPRPELGTADDLLQAVTHSHDIGVNIAPFISIAIVRNRYAARYGAKLGTEDWTYHPDLIPVFRPFYTKFWDGAAVDTNNMLWEQDVTGTLTDWINRGLGSFSWDVFQAASQNGAKPGLDTVIENVRKVARARDPQSTFSGESVSHLEFDSPVLDYTWNWLDYEDAAPITSVLRTPRLNCNVESSPLVVKKCFADNLFLNVMPRKLDDFNGTALISDKPELAAALTQVVNLRRKFLPYFVAGTFIGDSVLDRPAKAFVRGYQLKNKMLVLVLNNQKQANAFSVQSDLGVWLPSASSFDVKYYDANGKLMDTTSLQDSHWVGTTAELQPDELAVFEIQAK
jgi:hypothetical protein